MKNKTPLAWIYSNSRRFIPWIVLMTFLGIVLSFVGVRFALASRDVINIATKQSEGSLTASVLVLLVLIAVQLVSQMCISLMHARLSGRINIAMRERLFSGLMNKDIKCLSGYHSGELLNRIHSDVSVIASGVLTIIPNGMSFITRIIFSFSALYILDPGFAVICLVAGPVIMLVARMYSRRMKGLHKKCQETDGKIKAFMQECLQNILVIKSFRSEDAIADRCRGLQTDNYRYQIKKNNISLMANIVFYIALTAGYYFALAWCAYKIYAGVMTFGVLTAILQLFTQLETPFKSLSGVIPQYYNMIASAERVIELENMPDDDFDRGEEIGYDDFTKIEVDNLTFAYDGDDIFKNAGYTVGKGDFVAIVGISGIGKSTLLKLMLGIITPCSGNVYVCSKDKKIPAGRAVRPLFAYVPQGNMILSGSIRDNIVFMQKDIDEQRVIEAAKVADAWSFISELPEGLDTVVGEKGLGLSEGQIQRIAIARAVYYDAPILLLDECTSALDEATERRVLENLKKCSNKTCITISHKRTAIEMCDRVIKIEDGRILDV